MITPDDIDRDFREKASSALNRLGVSGTQFLVQHPNQSKKELAGIIGSGVTARGLTMVLFEEAWQHLSIKQLVQELLYREIVEEFPNGWNEEGSVRPTVKIGGWHYDVSRFAPVYENSTAGILRALGTTHKPIPGWKPLHKDDERLISLFEEFWIEPL